ncbi:MAG: hypothetical protein AVDCRST_MAG75-2025 [uncultured Propionibacteriaceae bacterium]|uniref:Uncharacterized protein n=1 Tax=uncultured Propionibacteriaceae bacterium TaxID=257457 RepID=A0A6J4NVR8_9ACTN|nr:MAG: hypothetical protein AVDCRST_MAG75-2025 [uncultured Propionibacteriaceae bacterium]
MRTKLGRVGSTAATVLALATPLGAVPYSLAEASLDPGMSPGAANEQLDTIYATHTWISLLAMVTLPLIVLSIITLGIVVLRRQLVLAWGPVASLCAIPISVAAGALAESGLPLPHPPAWIFLGRAQLLGACSMDPSPPRA